MVSDEGQPAGRAQHVETPPRNETPPRETPPRDAFRQPSPGDRVLVLHAYPPVACLHTFERGLRELGHDVVCVGPEGHYGSAEAWSEVDPECAYHTVAADAELADIFHLIGGEPDWVFYLRPSNGFLPRGLAECPVPTVAWLEDEFKNAQAYHHLAYYFDLVGTAYPEVEESFRRAGHDNWVCFNYFTASWLAPPVDVEFSARHIDVSFVGHAVPNLTRLRCVELEKLRRLAREGVKVCVIEGPVLLDMMRVYTHSRIVFQHSGQGPPNLTYRVGEAMAAGAMVIAKRPNRVAGLGLPLVEGEHIVYYDDFEEAADAVRYYLAHETECRRIAEAGLRYVRDDAPWVSQVESFLTSHVYTIDGDFRARRRERLKHFRVDARKQQIDRALYYAICSHHTHQARAELERIPGWEADPYLRGMVAAAGSPDYFADVEAALLGRPDHLLTLYNHAERLFALRDSMEIERVMAAVETAIRCFERASPRDLPPSELEGLIALSDLRLGSDISDAYLRLLPGAPLRERLHSLLLAQLHKSRGIMLYEQREHADAQLALSRAARDLTDHGRLSAYLARTATELGRPEDAVAHYRHALSSEPHFAEAYCELASLLRGLDRPSEAAELLEDSLLSYLALDAWRIAMHLGLAEAYLLNEQRDDARDVLRRGVAELDTGSLDTGVYRIARQKGAISRARHADLRRALGALAARVG